MEPARILFAGHDGALPLDEPTDDLGPRPATGSWQPSAPAPAPFVMVTHDGAPSTHCAPTGSCSCRTRTKTSGARTTAD
ncbi:hypothetical protein ACIF8T_37975 [Streptomyces sp. NPDC085946]|uniref:hypothetical protein n=1 Tax=Streptomyces sp. NPDC085946 TaxID=3365744 RepID=UPI0037CD1805